MKKRYSYLLQLFCIVFFSTASHDANSKSSIITAPNDALYELKWSFIKTLVDDGLETRLKEGHSEFRSIDGCPGPTISVNADPGDCGAVVNWTIPTTDNTLLYEIEQVTGPAEGSFFSVGGPILIEYEEQLIGTDTPSGAPRCSFNVTVVDNEEPTASNPAALNVQCSADVPAVDITVVTDEADNCGGAITVEHVSDVSDGNSNPEVITRTYSVTDLAGKSINVTQTITVDDTTDPTASNPVAVNVQCSADVPAVDITAVNDEADNCAGAITVAHVSDVSNGNSNPEVITRTYSVTDLAGKSINVTQTITVDDTTAPTASNPTPVNVQCSADVPAVDITVVTDEADNCGGALTVEHVSDVSNGNSNPEVITRTYSVTDLAGKSINVTQTITVDDTTAPTASNPTPVNVQCSADVPAVDITVVTDEADNCGGALTVEHLSDVSDGNSNPEVITRTYSVTDLAGKSINVTQTITVNDTTPPTITCPTNQTGSADAACNFSILDYTGLAIVGDNCSGAITITQVPAPGTIVVAGTTNIVLTATDASSNPITCNFDVLITANPATITDPGNKNQTVCINTTIAPIAFAIGGGGTGATATGLPAGVAGSFTGGTFTLSGTPSVSGVFNYTVTTTGTCTPASQNGTLTINPNHTISDPGNKTQTVCINTPIASIAFAVGGGGTGATTTGLPAGVTGAFSAGTYTLSGTPSVSGTFNYTVTTTGTCTQASQSGTLTVSPNKTISNPSNKIQTLCVNTAIAPIVFTTSGGATGATTTGLPAGVTGSFAGAIYTLSGTPTAVGTFNYTVNTTGGTCVQASQTGTLTVNPNASISNPGNKNQTVCITTPIASIAFAIGGGGTNASATGLPAGVTGAFNAGTFTISGAPTASGTFNYTVTTTGTCSQTSQSGTLTVNPNKTISNPGNKNQTLCVNTAIAPIVFTTSGGATGATTTGLPAGVTGSFAGAIYTLSGTPTAVGTFNYTVNTTGGTCVQASQTGTLTVNPNASISNPGNKNQTVCITTPIASIAFAIGGGGTNASATGLPAGVTGAFNAGTFTISGAPTASGTFNYTVTTTGTCSQTSQSGTLTVNPNKTISNPGNKNQTLCVNTAIAPIVFTTSGGATGANTTGLPAGVTGSFAGAIYTLSGTPTAVGTFNYTVNTTGGTCVQASQTGTLTVNPTATISNPTNKNQTVCFNTAIAPISFNIGGGGTGATATGLPAGITGVFNAGTFTISGTSSVSGTFNYTVSAPAPSCSNTTASGTIKINANPTVTLAASSTTICPGGTTILTATSAGPTGEEIFSGTNNATIGIPNNNSTGIYSEIIISGSPSYTIMAGDIVEVTLNIDHNTAQDIDAYLYSPTGATMTLFTDIGGNGNDFTNTRIRTDINNPIQNYGTPFNGIYSPEGGTINNLFGASFNGQWRLRLIDDGFFTTGTLLNWSLKIIRPGGNYTTTITGVGPAAGTVAPIAYTGAQNSVATATATPPTAQGTYTYTARTTDANGCISASTNVIITVLDNAPPTAVCKNITVQLNAGGTASITAAAINNGSSDTCSPVTLLASKTAFTCADVGPNTVILTVSDANGNTATCNAIVTVEDTVAPVAICQDTTIQLDSNGVASITAADINNGSTDACGIASLVLSKTDFDCTNVGANTVTLTVTDNNGNSSVCTSTVTVEDNIDPTAICQNITVQLDASGNATITPEDIDNGSNDNCGIANLALNINTFDCTNVGANPVVLTVTDSNGNTSTCNATVTVEDNVAPAVVCQDITVQLDASGNASITTADIDDGSSDACGSASLSLDITSFDCNDVGANTVTLTMTDTNSNSSSCTATVTVEDNIAPTAICQNITIQLNAAGTASITANDIDNGSNDVCGITSSVLDITAFDCTNVGPNTVTLTVTDTNGNSSTCTSTVTVEDTVNPNAICQDLTVQLDATGNVTITPADINNGSNDNCGIASLALDVSDFSCSDVGANTVILTVTDINGNTATCSSTVTVEDNVLPTVICKDITVQLDATGNATITPADIDNGSGDPCGSASLSLDITAFDCSDVGANTVTLTMTDSNGNSNFCTATVTVEDNLAPTAICQDLTVQLDVNGTASITPSQIDNGSTDACGIQSLVLDKTTFDCTNVGANTVILTVTDNNGNISTCSSTVTVQDSMAPNALCQDITIQLDAAGNASITTADIDNGSNDNCGIASLALDITTFDCTNVGANTVILTVIDTNGNSATCTSTVTVEDTIAPIVTCPADIILNNCSYQNVTYTIPFTDNCAGATITQIDNTGFTSGDNFPIGVTTLQRYRITDASGNETICEFNVTINDDLESTLNCPGPITVNNDAGNCTAIVNYVVTASNTCPLSTLTRTTGLPSGSAFPVGVTIITYELVSAGQTTITCTFDVTVIDIQKPVIACEPAQTKVADPGLCQTNVTVVPPTFSDNCSAVLTNDFRGTTDPSGVFDVGTTTITWTATDPAGLTATCTQDIIVIDNQAPVIVCPGDITLNVDSGNCTAVATYNISFTDNCTTGATMTQTDDTELTSGDAFPVGTTTLEYTAIDASLNTTICTFDVIVIDNDLPDAVCQDVTVTLDATGTGSFTVADIGGGSTDNCGIASMVASQTTFDCSDISRSPITVLLTVTDNSGNTSTCDAIVTIEDPAQNATVTISADPGATICAGEAVTFTATPTNGGTNPRYEWFINTDSQGNDSPTFAAPPLADGDVVSVQMSSSLSACITTPSNGITMQVNDLPLVNGPASLCIGSTGTLTPATSGWVSTSAFASVDGLGVVTPVAAGTATFTFTDGSGCSADFSVIINAITDVSTNPSEVCEGETIQLQPAGTGWSVTNGTGTASVDGAGILTGETTGTITVTYADGNGCSAPLNITVSESSVINSVTASPAAICAGVSSILTANVEGAATFTETLVNYDFNLGSEYGNLFDSSTVPNINSNVSGSVNYNKPNQGTTTTPDAFTQNNTAGGALRQLDDYRDGANGLGGTDDSGDWNFNLNGPDLSNYSDFRVYFQAKRDDRFGDYKRVRVDYRVNGGTWVNNYTTLPIPAGNTDWVNFNFLLPPAVNNPNDLDIRLQVNDGSDYDFGWYNCFIFFCLDYGAHNIDEPHILIDNFQVQGSTTGSTFDYAWTANTGANAGLPPGSEIPDPNNGQITVNPLVTTEYTVTVTNSDGCPTTETVTVTVNPAPIITVSADYCVPDDPNTEQNEANLVYLLATSSVPGTSWEWDTGETTAGIFVDTAGTYQVIGTGPGPNSCSTATTINVATELVVNGDFTNYSPGDFVTEYTVASGYYNGNNASGLYPEGRFAVDLSAYGLSNGNPQGYHPNFHGRDHTNNAVGPRNFLMVNGSTGLIDPDGGGPLPQRQRIIWQQTVTVEPGASYYFSAYAMNLNPGSPARLQFEVNGVLVGSVADLSTAPTPTIEGEVNASNWVRFYSTPTWSSGTNTTAVIRIRNLNTTPGGNDFALDDISFGTLDPFIKLATDSYTDKQIVCQDSSILDIIYQVGGGLTGPTITGLPDGVTANFDGLNYTISGTPTEFGLFNYTITLESGCSDKTAEGTITINEPAIVDAGPDQSVCESEVSITLAGSINNVAAPGLWTTDGNGTFSDDEDPNAIYTFNGDVGVVNLTFTSVDPDGIDPDTNLPFPFDENPCVIATDTVEILIQPFVVANAGTDVDLSGEACNVTITGLSATPPPAPGLTGAWTVTSLQDANSYSFSDIADPNATFDGQSGESYTLAWTLTVDGTYCADTLADEITVTFANCEDNIVFDGTDDYISFGNNYGLTTPPFSIEVWIKTAAIGGTQTILSKRDTSLPNTGYDLTLANDKIQFNYNNASVIANQKIDASRWYHVALTFNGAAYTLYIDGINVGTTSSTSAPAANGKNALIGAKDSALFVPTNYFNGGVTGGLDEIRFWDVALSIDQIRLMMNQEIEADGGNVMGSVTGTNVISGLTWASLAGYYQMNQLTNIDISNGNLNTNNGSPLAGKLINMTALQAQTAPLPYVSTAVGGNWTSLSTWINGNVQLVPNGNGVNGTPVNWNIVRTQGNISSTNKNITVLGLLVDSNRLSIQNTIATNGQKLTVTRYLNINAGAVLDLVGESQLLQTDNSIVNYDGTGLLERDQQGSGNMFNYNYWGSPVSTGGSTNARTYTLDGIIRDGSNNSPVGWTSALNGSAPPLTLSTRWLYTFENEDFDNYNGWLRINQNTVVDVGLGFLMKGAGIVNAPDRNYTFIGQPNNGTILVPIGGPNLTTLVGNPYPSAIDADEFIDNNVNNLEEGTLIFWEQAPSNNSHYLAAYLGRYSYYNKIGGLSPTTPPEISGSGNALKEPKRFVPVGQGFFVTGDADGGNIEFNNGQRIFEKESGSASVFFRTPEENTKERQNRDTDTLYVDNIQRIRLAFTTPEKATRHLLLGFTPDNAATDSIDYGYDASNSDDFPSDLSFAIAGKKFVIQGVGAFDISKKYPLDMTLGTAGNIEISLTDLENFDAPVDVFVYDAVADTYFRINTVSFQMQLNAGDYVNRFSIVFQTDETLTTIDADFKDITVKYLQKTDEIYVKTPASIEVRQVYLINMAGQSVRSWNMTNMNFSQEFKIPVKDISEGNYVLKIETNTTSYNKKVIVKF